MKLQKVLGAVIILFVTSISTPPLANASGGNGRFTITRGPITALTASTVTVSGITFTLDPSTEYEDINDQATTIAAFSVGDFVKVKADPSSLIAAELDLEDDNDDNKTGGGSTEDNGTRQQTVSAQCEFPSSAFLQKGVAQSIKDALVANGATNVKVDVSLRYSRVSRVKIATAQAAPGLVITANPAGAADPITLSGAITPESCQGTVTVRARVRANGVSDTINQTLTVNGILVAQNRGK